MPGRSTALVLLLGLTTGGALLAACSTGTAPEPPTAPPTTTPGAVISSEPSPVGRILATGTGYTLYVFASDTSGRSTCITDLCVTLWPPLLARGGSATGPGVKGSLVSQIRRPDGSTQMTYGGHALYTWRGDSKPAYVTGQALLNAGGYWYVITTSGRVVTTPFRVGNAASPSSPPS